MHGRQVSENIVDQYLVWQEGDYEEIFNSAADRVDERLISISDQLKNTLPLEKEKMEEVHGRVKKMQDTVGYDGDYNKWITGNLPPRLENMIQP